MKHFIIFILILSSCNHSGKKENNNSQPNILELSYGEDSIHLMDIYPPSAASNNGRLILYIHGGGWYTGNRREATHWAMELQRFGYSVVCIDYTLADNNAETCYPKQIRDIDSAISFLRNNQLRYGLEMDRAVIMGASAGAQLALMYAYRYNKRKFVKAAISLCGIINLTDTQLQKANLGDRSGLKMLNDFICSEQLQDYVAASPISNMSRNSVPTYFAHGSEDEIVPVMQSIEATIQLRKLEVPTRLSILRSVDHDLLNIDMKPEFLKIDSFIRSNVQ